MKKNLDEKKLSFFANKRFSGKTVLITGATSGIGREMAKLLAGCGCRILALGRDRESMKSLLKELNENSGLLSEGLIADLADRDIRRKLIKKISKNYEIDILVNSAGFGYLGDFCLMAEDSVDSMREVNIDTVVDFCREFLPKMAKKHQGGILNIGSTASFFGTPGSSLYGATKHFILGFTDALHQEAISDGVYVSGVYPGHTHSRFVERATSGKVKKWTKGMSPVLVAKLGLEGLGKNKIRIIPGFYNKMLFLAAKILPISFILKELYAKFIRNHTQ